MSAQVLCCVEICGFRDAGAIPADRSAPALAGRHFGPAREAGGRTQPIPFTLRSALVTSTEAGLPKGDLGWRSSLMGVTSKSVRLPVQKVQHGLAVATDLGGCPRIRLFLP